MRAAIRHTAGRWTHATGYHLARLPLYCGRLLRRIPAGAKRGLIAIYRWLFDLEARPIRVAAGQDSGQLDGYLKLAVQRDRRVRRRGLLALAVLLVGLPALALAVVHASAVQLAVGVLLVGLAVGAAGVPQDQPVATRAVVAATYRRITSDVIVTALAAIGVPGISSALTKNPHAIGFAAPITRDAEGYRADIDLPAGVVAGDVIERRVRLAGALGRPLGCVWPEPVPSVHPGRLCLWVGDQDMITVTPPPWPLETVGTADVFSPAPIGTDPRGRWVSLTLMFTSVVIGAIPRMGKTVWLRHLLLIAALDWRTEIHAIDLKGTGDLAPIKPVAHRYRSGVSDEDIAYGLADVRALQQELDRRAKIINGLPRDICPDSKVTPELAANPTLGLHPIVLAVDECQRWFDHSTYGPELASIVADLVRRGPAVGIIVILATQRPDADSIPPAIGSNAAVRIALKVFGHRENDMTLGPGMYSAGFRATAFSKADLGIALVVGVATEPMTVRGVYLDAVDADKVVARAKLIREQHGVVSGFAADADTTTPTVDTFLADAYAVTQGADFLWSTVIIRRLAALRPELYRDWTELDSKTAATQLANRLRQYGISTEQKWGTDPDTGETANRRGVSVADLRRALDRRRTEPPA
ncbi:S-DNA-T family DNA segregation ATPase FtsK/SpoIIIE [Crossiella equi]|uniref:S-DNA-T family DNA segregation ATPase FtsK/SpoIIIE n=1 Tax=Crossiella equi TaxID=130796 RepID=A0ABS5AJ67_9PSEU|nr:hypothetical protein [Crossiella equi]MBP2476618.1 S-DNA-T family DNA segregation ATPase FtsK/SpoIIIE [Crossiella equi]